MESDGVRVFWEEMRKIWRPWVILAVGVVMVLGYYLLVNSQFSSYYRSVDYQMAEQWVKRYGPTMEEDERRDAEKDVLAVEREMDEWIADQPEFAAAGIFDHHDWDDYRNRTGSLRFKRGLGGNR